jgi:hypothetical protein
MKKVKLPEKNWAGLPLRRWPEASQKWKKILALGKFSMF